VCGNAHRPCSGLRVPRAQHGANDGDAGGTGAHDGRRIRRRDAPDPDDGDTLGRVSSQRREALGTERRPGVALRGCCKAGTDTPVIGRKGGRALGLLGRADGDAEQKAGGKVPAQRRERGVVPTEVRARGAGGEGDVGAIIDEHGNRQGRNQCAGQLQNFVR